MKEQIWDELCEKLSLAGVNAQFIAQLKETYQNVRKKAKDNKEKHFKLQKCILYVSAGVNILNIVVSLTGSVRFDVVIPYITSASSVCSILVTMFLAKKEMYKYSETWFRHQKHQSDMEFEILEYVCMAGDYSGRGDQEAGDLFVHNMIKIWRKNQERFENNMSRFDTR